MDNAMNAVEMLFHILGGLGLFFTGVGALWLATLYKEHISDSVAQDHTYASGPTSPDKS